MERGSEREREREFGGLASTCCTPLVSSSLTSYQNFACVAVLSCLMPHWRNWWSCGTWEPMPTQKFRWDESSGGDSAGEWRYVLPRKKRARKTATAQDSGDTSKTGAKGSDRRRTYLEVILSTQRDSESEQQNDVDTTGAGAGASGAATAASGASAGTVTGEKKKAQEEAKRRKERIQAALTQLGSGDDVKDVRDKLNQEMSRAKKASEPQHLANDIEGKAAWVSREARPAERAGGTHRQIAGASDTEASRPPMGDTRIGCASCTAGEEYSVRWCWQSGEMIPYARAGET